ncbi:MAG: hypothetical protein SF339_08320 [Blastocatellia bacterium]|nr:hypothetical protein [Blastocatellia bacterium]
MNQVPTITILFRGLYLFSFEKDRQFCQASILETDRHTLKVRVATIGPGSSEAPQSASMLDFEAPQGNISFEVGNRLPGIGAYQVGAFGRSLGHDLHDFRWVLDMEGPELHRQKLSVKTGALPRAIMLRHGLFYSHSLRPVRLEKPGAQPMDVDIAREIGCAVHLGENEEGVLRFGENPEFSVKLAKVPNMRYEIMLDNACAETTPGGDFERYYDVLEVPPAQRIRISPAPGAPPPGDPRNPCDPIFMGDSNPPLGG